MIYRLTYCNKNGVEARVDIQKGLATPVIEVEGTERPFILSYNNDKGNKSGMFLSSSVDIEIYETTDLDSNLNFNINNLKTSNETELSVTHYINNIVSWRGFIIPDFFSIEVRNNPVITMTASDRLGTLKNVTLSDLPSMISLRELAILCLDKTGLTLPLRTMADFNNGTGINDLFNSKILTQRLSDTKGRSISCYDILSSILTASNSFLVQRSGGWHIINKIQHEAGSGKLYTGATSFINWSDVIFNFSDISIGGRRTIIPVASTVGVFHEFGGGRLHPENYDFLHDLTGWNPVGGFVATIDNRKVDTFTTGGSGGAIISPVYGDATEKKYLVNNNEYVRNVNPIYLESDPIPIFYKGPGAVNISLDINAVGPSASSAYIRVAIIATNGTDTKILDYSGNFIDYPDVNPPVFSTQFNDELAIAPTILKALSNGLAVSGKLEVEDDLSLYSLKIRLYGGGGGRYVLINSASVIVKSGANDNAKGTLYKTERVDNFTKAHDIDTSLFADYLTTGLDGYFYRYAIDDTSSLYNSANELTSKWTAYNDPEQLPLLQHITRQKSRLFSVAHDLLSAEIEASNFDPLAIFVACEKRYTVVSAQFDFFKSNLSVELEEVAFQSASIRDFIYSYFGDGESGIKSIGGISGGSGGGSTGGGLTPEQLEILSWWKKDPDRENTIFTEMNAYSKLELSAYGAGDGGGGGGSDYERLDTWADYDSSKAGWVLSAFLGNDLNTRVTAIDGRVTDLENSAGSGSVTSVGISVPTGLSVSNSPITSSGVIAIGLQTGYSIPTTEKQGQWDTAYGWGDHAGKYIRFTTTNYYGDADLLKNIAFWGLGENIPNNINSAILSITPFNNEAYGFQIGGRNNNFYHRPLENNVWGDWVRIWHSGDFTQAEVTNWREVRAWWQNVGQYLKRDVANQALYTDENFYSTKEVSAYGAGDGGGGGGSDYERLDTWASYDSSRAGWVLSAFLGNDLNTRVTAIDGRVTDLENTAGGGTVTSVGIGVPTGLSVSNSPITSSGVIAIGLQTGYSIPTTVKQGQWDTAYSNSHTHSNKTVLDGITSGLVSNWNTAFGWGDHANKYSHIAHSGYFNSIRSADNRNVEDTPTSRNAGLYVDFKTSAAANLAGSTYVGVLTFRPYGSSADISGGGIMQIGSNNNSLYYRRFLDAGTWRDWVSIWHSGDFTQAEVTNWREVRTWWQNVGQYLKRDATNQALYTDENFYSTKEVSAYGAGTGGGGGGGIIETVYGYGDLGQTFNNSILTDTFNAYTINQINTRLASVENGSATTVNTTGTGNAITSISKAGTVITAEKGLTFSLSNHLHTGVYEPVFSKNTAFNKNFGTVAGTVAEGNHTHSYLPLSGGTMSGNWAITATEGVNAGVRTYKLVGNGILWAYRPTTLEAIRHGIGFGWYDTEWVIGNIRGGATDSYGFGIGYRSDRTNAITGAFRIATNGTAYLNNVAIATVNSNVASATKLQTPRTIAGVSFDGTANIAIPFANLSSKPTTLGEYGITDAVTLNTAQTITGAKTFTSKMYLDRNNINNIIGFRNNGINTVSFGYEFNKKGLTFYNFASAKDLFIADNGDFSYATDRFIVKASGNVGIGTDSPTQKLHVVGNILATGTTTTPKVIFNSAGWSMEQVGNELQLKYNNLIASRFLSDGSIVGLGEITAYGEATGGEGVSLLRTGGTMTGNLTMSADIIMNSGRAIGKSNLPLKLLGNALTYNASNVLTEANTSTQIKMGNGWTIEQTTSALTIKKNGVVKGTFNA